MGSSVPPSPKTRVIRRRGSGTKKSVEELSRGTLAASMFGHLVVRLLVLCFVHFITTRPGSPRQGQACPRTHAVVAHHHTSHGTHSTGCPHRVCTSIHPSPVVLGRVTCPGLRFTKPVKPCSTEPSTACAKLQAPVPYPFFFFSFGNRLPPTRKIPNTLNVLL